MPQKRVQRNKAKQLTQQPTTIKRTCIESSLRLHPYKEDISSEDLYFWVSAKIKESDLISLVK